MTETHTPNTTYAVKNCTDESLFIYRAELLDDGTYKLSAERYFDNELVEAACIQTSLREKSVIDTLLLDICKGALEPCHLKDIVEDAEL